MRQMYIRYISKRGNHQYGEKLTVEGLRDEETQKELNFKVHSRSDFLTVLDSYHGNNAIVVDYRNHLRDLEERTQSYKAWRTETPKDDLDAWAGFYRKLEERLWHESFSFKVWCDLYRILPGWGSWGTARADKVFWFRPWELETRQ